MKNIFVPVNFSESTENALNYALGIAMKTGAAITLYHSFFEQIYFSDGGFSTGFESNVMITDEIVNDLFSQKKKNLDELKQNLLRQAEKSDHKDLAIEIVIDNGNPDHQILSACERINPDLLIMASSGIGKNFILSGSVARRIMDSSSVPVMAIPNQALYKEIKNVAFMTEFDQSDVLILKKFFELFNRYSPMVYVVHLNIDGKNPDAEQQMEKLLLDPMISDYSLQLEPQIIDCENQQKTIESYVKDKKIDLISILPHKRNLFKQVFTQDLTKKDLFQTNLPLLGMH